MLRQVGFDALFVFVLVVVLVLKSGVKKEED
jgi:hypothetical protein